MAKIGKAINGTEQNSEKDQRKMIQKKMIYLILELIKKMFSKNTIKDEKVHHSGRKCLECTCLSKVICPYYVSNIKNQL